MKTKLLTLVFLLVAHLGLAQAKEGFGLFTDRDLYVSGETVLLKIFAPSRVSAGIVTVDLFNSTGTRITGVKLELAGHETNGFIEIPDTVGSGGYLVRVSARTIPEQTLKEIFIANRFKGLPESSAVLRPKGAFQPAGILQEEVLIEGVGKGYGRREKVHATIGLPNDLLLQTEGNLSISVSQATPEFTALTFETASKSKPNPLIGNEGIIVEGLVTDVETGRPFKNAVVVLSIPDSIPGFKYCTTRENGRFLFQLKNYYGRIPMVLQCEDLEKSRILKLTLSGAEPLTDALPPFESQIFSSDLRKKNVKNIESANYSRIFGKKLLAVQPAQKPKADKYPFYGLPSQVIYPKLFIDLPNFAEISRELIQNVKFRVYNRNPTLQVFNTQSNNFFNDTPLVLLNGVPMRDLNTLKEMGTREIDRIEICQTERFNGTLRFPGVVALYNSRIDNARIKASDYLIKWNLDAIQPPSEINPPSENPLKEPDLRQVLLWEPTLKPAQKIELTFRTSDLKGSYQLILRGKNKNGSIFYKEQYFEVQ